VPRVSRSRLIAAEPDRVWDLVSDAHSLPRWWPKAVRVEDVRGPSGARGQWTMVLESERGVSVRADYRCTASTEPKRIAWEQQIEGSPFERVLREARTEIGLEPVAGGTEVTLTLEETLRGMSKLGGTMMRGAAKQRLDEALDGMQRVLVG
jgi:uncharacterized protein YndB with AHSA1/START domain